jgi:hypothetical protein
VNGPREENGKLWLLRAVGGTSTQNRLINDIYPLLQYVSVRLKLNDGSYIHSECGSPLRQLFEECGGNKPVTLAAAKPVHIPDTLVASPVPAAIADTLCRVLPRPFGTGRRRYGGLVFALKTNLLYDAALVPNVSIEASMGHGWSVALEGNWSWWVFGRPVQKRDYYRIQAIGLELRKWIGGSRPLQGHWVGLYSLGGTYDLRLWPADETSGGWLSNWSWSAGLSYGYSLPVGRRLSLELGLGAGYLGGTYYDYDYCMEHGHWRWLSTKRRNYWGLTRAGVSLAWRFSVGQRR